MAELKRRTIRNENGSTEWVMFGILVLKKIYYFALVAKTKKMFSRTHIPEAALEHHQHPGDPNSSK